MKTHAQIEPCNEEFTVHEYLRSSMGRPEYRVCAHIRLSAVKVPAPLEHSIPHTMKDGTEIEIQESNGFTDVMLTCDECQEQHLLSIAPPENNP